MSVESDQPQAASTTVEQEHIRAFQVLAHAEAEECLEQLVSTVAERSVARWESHARPRRVVVALLVAYKPSRFFEHWDARTVPSIGGPLRQPLSSAMRADVGSALNDFRKAVKSNNGIRRTNVLALVRPLGLADRDIGPTWLSTLDSFSDLRGRAAHASAAGVKKELDALSEYNAVGQVSDGLEALDALLMKLRRGA